MNLPKLTYDAAENILFCAASGVVIDTRDDIQTFFDEITAYWQAHCQGKKVYVLVDYEGFSINQGEAEAYTARMRQAVDLMALTVIRYGGNVVQRVAARSRAIQFHLPANLYKTREEALAVVRGLQAGTISLET